jgi:negative regulator of flagellin synthesis FlgM
MKIGSIENKPPVHVGAERKVNKTEPLPQPLPVEPVAHKGPPQPLPAEAGTQVLLSAAAKEISELPPVQAGFDGAKVERISKAIRAGTFKVNPEAIADKLIANAAELLSRKAN